MVQQAQHRQTLKWKSSLWSRFSISHCSWLGQNQSHVVWSPRNWRVVCRDWWFFRWHASTTMVIGLCWSFKNVSLLPVQTKTYRHKILPLMRLSSVNSIWSRFPSWTLSGTWQLSKTWFDSGTRMVGHITYLSEEAMKQKFGRDLKIWQIYVRLWCRIQVESYLRYQGEQFSRNLMQILTWLWPRPWIILIPRVSMNIPWLKQWASLNANFGDFIYDWLAFQPKSFTRISWCFNW